MFLVSRSSSGRPQRALRGVEPCCPRGRQARRSDALRVCRTWSIHRRRREGLRSFASRTFGSPGGLGQDYFVQRQIRHSTPEPRILGLQLLVPIQLIPSPAAILFAPSGVGLHRDADLEPSISDRAALSLKHFNLPQLQRHLLRFISLSSHLMVLLKRDNTIPVAGAILRGHSKTTH